MKRFLKWRVVVAVIAVLFGCHVAQSVTSTSPKRILLLHSFGENFAPYSVFAQSFRAELAHRLPEQVDLYDISLLSARFASKEQDAPLVDYLLSLFSDHRLDLVVAIGGPAVRFSTEYRQRLFPEVPMLVSAVDERRLKGAGLTANDAVVPVKLDFPRVVADIRKLLPETRSVAVVFGDSALERQWVAEVRKEFQTSTSDLDFLWLDQLPFEQLKARVSALPGNSAILFAMLSVDAAGVPQVEGRALREISAGANAPSFGLFDFQLGDGIVGGALISTESLAQSAANVAIRLLNGEAPASIKTPTLEAGAPVYDSRQLQRWGIAEARLPSGSTVLFRTPTLWAEYRWQIITAGVVVLLQSLLITSLLIERHARRAAQLESRSRLVEVAHLNRAATTGAMSAAIAHELNQPLGAILANTEAAERLLTKDPPDIDEIKEILSDIRQSDQRATEIIARLRDLLRKNDIKREEVDAGRAIRNVIQILEPEARNRDVTLRSDKVPSGLVVLGDIVCLEQILLNLALNGMDAMTGTASPRVLEFQAARKDSATATISVLDSGGGIPQEALKTMFDPFYTTKLDGTGLGLSIVRAIVEAMGGRTWAENRPNGGAAVLFTLPAAKKRRA